MGIIPLRYEYLFYDHTGSLNEKLLRLIDLNLKQQSLGSVSVEFKIVGWYRLRRDTPHSTLSLLEKVVCQNMIERRSIYEIDKSKSSNPFVFLLNQTQPQLISGGKYYDKLSEYHQLIEFDRNDLDSYKVVEFKVKNISSLNTDKSPGQKFATDQLQIYDINKDSLLQKIGYF